ncbi:hypothetical protein GCM10007940_30440 [Portibacter lacus]|uniref:Uncharacterized protein n=1 Tax=Portibacter lacus TaxID=1099794 RepID=A0AA37SPD5_9BACT|nr:hypothetical protein GCM10007940_30440 [Portibacter lacus]
MIDFGKTDFIAESANIRKMLKSEEALRSGNQMMVSHRVEAIKCGFGWEDLEF